MKTKHSNTIGPNLTFETKKREDWTSQTFSLLITHNSHHKVGYFVFYT